MNGGILGTVWEGDKGDLFWSWECAGIVKWKSLG